MRIVSRRLFSRPGSRYSGRCDLVSVDTLRRTGISTGIDFFAPGFVQITDLDASILFFQCAQCVEEILMIPLQLNVFRLIFRLSPLLFQILDRPVVWLLLWKLVWQQLGSVTIAITANTTNANVPDRVFIMLTGLTPLALISKHKIRALQLTKLRDQIVPGNARRNSPTQQALNPTGIFSK